jgi:agmatinase
VPGSGAVERILAETEAVAARTFAAGASLLCLGGDHTIPYGPVRAAAAAFGPVGLIHLDSHQDSLDRETLPDRMVNHGTFATDLVNEGCVDPARSVQLYIRTTMANPAGHTIVHADEAIELGPDALADRVRGIVGDGPVYLSLDVDAVDPAFAPGCGTPCPGGPTSREVRRFLHRLAGMRVVAADLVEVCPPFDPAETTAVLAAFLGYDLLHLLAAGRAAR